jgi:hypothetical protein
MLQWLAIYLATALVLGALVLLLLPVRVLPFAPTVAFAVVRLIQFILRRRAGG